MKRLILILSLLASWIYAGAQQSIPLTDKYSSERWILAHFAKGQVPPFSFTFDGKESSGFIKGWKHSIRKIESTGQNTVQYEIVYRDPAGKLEVVCDATGFTDYKAVEWTLHFKNISSANSPEIKNVNALDGSFMSKVKSGATVYTAYGSDGTRRDFQNREIRLAAGETQNFSPTTKGSSDGDGFPFFNLHADGGEGVMVSIGWSGIWKSSFNCDGKGNTAVKAGMKTTDLYLYGGEEFRSPKISLMFWNGNDRMTGQNEFRQFILTHHTRMIDGKPAQAPFCGGFDWGDPSPCNEYSCLTEKLALAIAERYQMFGIMPDVMWLDAAWYRGSGLNFEGTSWYNSVGDWVPDPARFPQGLKPLSDELHSMGSKLMVWFEPERVMEGSKLAKEHPEWMLKRSARKDMFLFDLGNPEACDFLCKYIGDAMEENGIDYYRQDFNMDPVPYWTENDDPERLGMKEIRHIEGLYKFWDYILERFPQAQIDNCASGGRRLDLETTSRSLPLWRTDYNYSEPNGYQNHTYGLNAFLPLHGTGLYHSDNYNSRSSLSSAMVMNWELFTQDESVERMQKVIARYRKYYPLYLKDYYPLSGTGDLTGDDVCLAYQLNDAEEGHGIVIAFRRGADAPAHVSVSLKGLKAGSIYEVVNENDGTSTRMSGNDMMGGWNLSIDEAPGSVLFEYKEIR